MTHGTYDSLVQAIALCIPTLLNFWSTRYKWRVRDWFCELCHKGRSKNV